MEIPGIKSWEIYEHLLRRIIDFLSPFVNVVGKELAFLSQRETVLINSNFKCNFMINREKLGSILQHKYKIQCHFNENYPAIKCHYIPKSNVTSTFYSPPPPSLIKEEKKEPTPTPKDFSAMITKYLASFDNDSDAEDAAAVADADVDDEDDVEKPPNQKEKEEEEEFDEDEVDCEGVQNELEKSALKEMLLVDK